MYTSGMPLSPSQASSSVPRTNKYNPPSPGTHLSAPKAFAPNKIGQNPPLSVKRPFDLQRSVYRHLGTTNPALMDPMFKGSPLRTPDSASAYAIYKDFLACQEDGLGEWEAGNRY